MKTPAPLKSNLRTLTPAESSDNAAIARRVADHAEAVDAVAVDEMQTVDAASTRPLVQLQRLSAPAWSATKRIFVSGWPIAASIMAGAVGGYAGIFAWNFVPHRGAASVAWQQRLDDIVLRHSTALAIVPPKILVHHSRPGTALAIAYPYAYPHRGVALHSSAVERLSPAALECLVGHEIAHLCEGGSIACDLPEWVVPWTLSQGFWQRELTADLIAGHLCGNDSMQLLFESYVTSLYPDIDAERAQALQTSTSITHPSHERRAAQFRRSPSEPLATGDAAASSMFARIVGNPLSVAAISYFSANQIGRYWARSQRTNLIRRDISEPLLDSAS